MTRTIALALAILALAAPVASAAPMRDGSPPLVQDHSRPWQGPVPTSAPQAHHPAVATHNGVSPLVYIVPLLALAGAVAATTAFVRRPARA